MKQLIFFQDPELVQQTSVYITFQSWPHIMFVWIDGSNDLSKIFYTIFVGPHIDGIMPANSPIASAHRWDYVVKMAPLVFHSRGAVTPTGAVQRPKYRPMHAIERSGWRPLHTKLFGRGKGKKCCDRLQNWPFGVHHLRTAERV